MYSTWDSVLCGSLDGRGVWERTDTCMYIYIYVCMVESLRCLPETITTLLTSYTPIQRKKFFKKVMCYVPAGGALPHLLSSPLSWLQSSQLPGCDGVRPAVRTQPYKKTDVLLQTSCLGGLSLVQGLWSPSFLAGKSRPGGFSGTAAQGRLLPSL